MSQKSAIPNCPVCAKRSIVSKMKLFQISFDSAVLLCSREDCLGDLAELELVDRKIHELRKTRSKWKKKQGVAAESDSSRSRSTPMNSLCDSVSESAIKASNAFECLQIENQVVHEESIVKASPLLCTGSAVQPNLDVSEGNPEFFSILDDNEFWNNFETKDQNDSDSNNPFNLDMPYHDVNTLCTDQIVSHDNSDESLKTTDNLAQTSFLLSEGIARKDEELTNISCAGLPSSNVETQLDFSSLFLDFPTSSHANSVYGEVSIQEDNVLCDNQVSCDVQTVQTCPVPIVIPPCKIPLASQSASTSSVIKTVSTSSSILKKPTQGNKRTGIKNVKFRSPCKKRMSNVSTMSQAMRTDVVLSEDLMSQTSLQNSRDCGRTYSKKTCVKRPAVNSEIVSPVSFTLQRFLASDGEPSHICNGPPVSSLQELNCGVLNNSNLGFVMPRNVEDINYDIESLLRSEKDMVVSPDPQYVVPLTEKRKKGTLKNNMSNRNCTEATHRKQKRATVQKRIPVDLVKQQRKMYTKPILKKTTLDNTTNTLNSDQSNASDGDASVVSRSVIATTIRNSNGPKRNVAHSIQPRQVLKPSITFKSFPDKFNTNTIHQNAEQQKQAHDLLSSLLQGSNLFENKR